MIGLPFAMFAYINDQLAQTSMVPDDYRRGPTPNKYTPHIGAKQRKKAKNLPDGPMHKGGKSND